MNSCEIKDAKCCAVAMAAAYVDAAQHGESSDQMLYELMVMNSYIRTLERYNAVLDDEGKKVSLECGCKHGEPCITNEQANLIAEQITLACGNCNCNC